MRETFARVMVIVCKENIKVMGSVWREALRSSRELWLWAELAGPKRAASRAGHPHSYTFHPLFTNHRNDLS